MITPFMKLRLSKSPEKTLSDPEVCTESTEKAIRNRTTGTEKKHRDGSEETLSAPDVGTDGSEEAWKT